MTAQDTKNMTQTPPGTSRASTAEKSTRAGWPLLAFELKTLNLPLLVDYYKRLGLTLRDQNESEGTASFGFDTNGQTVLRLRQIADGEIKPSGDAGLYHFALLIPSEEDLGGFLKNLDEVGIQLAGFNDHGVSQALYLTDPEGNGIEIYADRPAETWERSGDQINMRNRYLDIPRLLRIAAPWNGFPADSRLGHMHLTVGCLDASQAFYEQLGMQVTSKMGPFCFMSWDGYHHHLGLNLFAGEGAPPVRPDVSGLQSFELSRPGLTKGTLRDPNGIEVIVS
jgi:catechol 2,3-dioxygenase